MGAPWRVLSAAYGPGRFEAVGSSVDVRFCRLPGWRFIYRPESAVLTNDQQCTTGDGVLRDDARVAVLRITPGRGNDLLDARHIINEQRDSILHDARRHR